MKKPKKYIPEDSIKDLWNKTKRIDPAEELAKWDSLKDEDHLYIEVSENLSEELWKFTEKPKEVPEDLLDVIKFYYNKIAKIYIYDKPFNKSKTLKDFYNTDYLNVNWDLEFSDLEDIHLEYFKDSLEVLMETLINHNFDDKNRSQKDFDYLYSLLYNDLRGNLSYFCDRYSPGRVAYSWVVYCMFRELFDQLNQ